MIKLKVFVLNLFWIHSILAFEVCNPDSTKNGPENYPVFIKNMNDLMEKFDGQVIDRISATLPTVKYDLRNVKLSGVKTCKVVMVNTCKEHLNFQFNLECDLFQVDEDYEMTGHINDVNVDGKGKGRVVCYKYLLKYTALLRQNTEDNKNYIQIKEYILDVEHKDKVVFDFQNLIKGDKDKSDAANKLLNENFATTDEVLRTPILRAFMDRLIESINGILKTTPVEQILPDLI